MDDPNNLYSNPQHNPLASTTDVQQKELPWYVPPASPDSGPRTGSAPPTFGGRGMPAGEVFPFLGRRAGGDFLLNLIVVGVLWAVWVCLYPLSAFAGLEALLWSMTFLRGILPTSQVLAPGLYAVVGGFVVAAMVLWTASRFEHVLARHLWYRLPRHLLRLALAGIAAAVLLQRFQGLPYNPMPGGLAPVLRNPVDLAIVAASVLASHFLLWNWTWGRNFWHARLEGARLRKRNA